MPDFDREFYEWRKGVGLLQKQAADVIGVGNSTIRSWESGKKTPNKFALETIRAKMTDYASKHATTNH